MAAIKKQGSNQEGFSILEVIISIAIFGIGILAVAHMQTVATRGNTLAGNLTGGVVMVQDIIENIVAEPYVTYLNENGDVIDNDDPDTGASADYSCPDDNCPTGYNVPPGHIVSWNVDVDAPENNNKTVQVIVESPAPGGTKTSTFYFIKGCLQNDPDHPSGC